MCVLWLSVYVYVYMCVYVCVLWLSVYVYVYVYVCLLCIWYMCVLFKCVEAMKIILRKDSPHICVFNFFKFIVLYITLVILF